MFAEAQVLEGNENYALTAESLDQVVFPACSNHSQCEGLLASA